jgi:hypothetical protein
MPAIREFCRKWSVREFSLFGSVLRSDFGPASDVDVLVRFDDSVHWTYWDYPDMTGELEAMFGRKVDLVEERALENPFRRRRILRTRRLLYAA